MRLSCSNGSFLTFLACFLAAVEGAFQHGDSCGVKSSDFMNDYFDGDYLVAGVAGCTLGDETGCHCAPDFGDDESLGEWKWQCNSVKPVVKFGPAEGKVCPNTIPLPKGFPDIPVVGARRGLQAEKPAFQPVECDTSIHPTGNPGDEVCPYSDCDNGGDNSAICGCVDLEKYGMGTGQRWFCMHSTCSCEQTAADSEELDTSSAPLTSAALPLVVLSAASVLLFSVSK